MKRNQSSIHNYICSNDKSIISMYVTEVHIHMMVIKTDDVVNNTARSNAILLKVHKIQEHHKNKLTNKFCLIVLFVLYSK